VADGTVIGDGDGDGEDTVIRDRVNCGSESIAEARVNCLELESIVGVNCRSGNQLGEPTSIVGDGVNGWRRSRCRRWLGDGLFSGTDGDL